MSKPLFSIMIPVYNISKYIDECLQSVLAQDFDDYEVILIDDGSPDNCGEICDKYCAENEKFRVIHKENGGLLAARRTGIQEADGKFGVFLDGDDYLEPTCLSSINEQLLKNPDADMVIYNYFFSFESDGSTKPKEPLFNEGRCFSGEEKKEIYDQLISTYNLNNLWIKAVKMELLKEDDTDYTPYYSNSYGEDLLQTLYPLTHANKVVYTGKQLYYYRINAQSMTKTIRYDLLDKQNSMEKIMEMLKYMDKWGMGDKKWKDKLFGRRYTHLAINFWKYWPNMNSKEEKIKLVEKFREYFGQMRENGYLGNKNISLMRKITIFLVSNKVFWGLKLLECIRKIKG